MACPTVPALASAGLTEATARAQGLQFRVHGAETSQWFSSLRMGEPTSGFTVLVEAGSQRLRGAHLLGPHADEVINVCAVAVRCGIRADARKQVLLAYPTNASDMVPML